MCTNGGHHRHSSAQSFYRLRFEYLLRIVFRVYGVYVLASVGVIWHLDHRWSSSWTLVSDCIGRNSTNIRTRERVHIPPDVGCGNRQKVHSTRAGHKSVGFLVGLVLPHTVWNSFILPLVNLLNHSIMIIMIIMYHHICDLFASEIILIMFVEMPRTTMFQRFIYIRER